MMVGIHPQSRDHLTKIMTPGFILEHADGIEAAIEKVNSTAYVILIAGFPVSAAPVPELLSAARSAESRSGEAAVVVMAPPEALDEAERLLDKGVSRILNPLASPRLLAQALSETIVHAQRHQVRAMVRLRVPGPKGDELVLAQTENLSRSGMFVRQTKSIPFATRFNFELTLSGETKPVTGAAEVVRTGNRSREAATGFGARFLGFSPGGERRLAEYLASQPITEPEPSKVPARPA